MSQTHLLVDEGTDNIVALPIKFVTDTDETSCSSDLGQFKAKCNPEWGWDDVKKEVVFNQVMELVNPSTPTKAAPTKAAAPKANP